MFACVEIKDGVLYFNAYGVNEEGAQEVDRFAIQKDTTQGEVVSDYKEAEEEEKNDQLKNFFKTFFEYIVKIFKVILNIFKIYILRVELWANRITKTGAFANVTAPVLINIE